MQATMNRNMRLKATKRITSQCTEARRSPGYEGKRFRSERALRCWHDLGASLEKDNSPHCAAVKVNNSTCYLERTFCMANPKNADGTCNLARAVLELISRRIIVWAEDWKVGLGHIQPVRPIQNGHVGRELPRRYDAPYAACNRTSLARVSSASRGTNSEPWCHV